MWAEHNIYCVFSMEPHAYLPFSCWFEIIWNLIIGYGDALFSPQPLLIWNCTAQEFVYLLVKCYQNNSWYDGWVKPMKAQALLKAPAHPHENEEESEGLGTSSSVVLIGYTHIPRQHVGDGAGENLAENARTFSLKRAGHRRRGGIK